MADSEATTGAQLAEILREQGKQTTQLAVMDSKLDQIKTTGDDHERRIRALEAARAKITGAAAASGILSGGIATLVYWALQVHR